VFETQKQTNDLDKDYSDLESENSKTPKKCLSLSQVGFKRRNYINTSEVSKSLKFTKRDIVVTSTTNNSRLNYLKWSYKSIMFELNVMKAALVNKFAYINLVCNLFLISEYFKMVFRNRK
jgi:hypothetical protein